MSPAIPILRGVQLLFTLAVLGLLAYITYVYTQPIEECSYDFYYGESCGSVTIGEPAVVAYLLFASIWSLLVIIVLAGVSICVKSVNQPIVATVLDALTVVFWFSAAIAFAVPAAGDWDPIGDAAIALSFVAFALFVATLVLNILRIVRGEGGGYGSKEENSQNPELAHI